MCEREIQTNTNANTPIFEPVCPVLGVSQELFQSSGLLRCGQSRIRCLFDGPVKEAERDDAVVGHSLARRDAKPGDDTRSCKRKDDRRFIDPPVISPPAPLILLSVDSKIRSKGRLAVRRNCPATKTTRRHVLNRGVSLCWRTT